ncbi:MAG: AAA family ATPase [Desulfobacterales bacterium]
MHLKQVDIVQARFPTRQHYPFNLAVLIKSRTLCFETPVTFFAGENGTGKSTLLKALAVRSGVNIWQGERRVRPAVNPYEELLFRSLDVKWTDEQVPGTYFDAQVFRNFASILDDWAANDPGVLAYFGGKSLLRQSHGQSLMSFFHSRFQVKGLYVLDEPETALSPKSQLELLNLLKDAAGAGRAQFIIATHSPILLACPASRIYGFDRAPIKTVAYEQTDHYRIYKRFMEDRGRYLR